MRRGRGERGYVVLPVVHVRARAPYRAWHIPPPRPRRAGVTLEPGPMRRPHPRHWSPKRRRRRPRRRPHRAGIAHGDGLRTHNARVLTTATKAVRRELCLLVHPDKASRFASARLMGEAVMQRLGELAQ